MVKIQLDRRVPFGLVMLWSMERLCPVRFFSNGECRDENLEVESTEASHPLNTIADCLMLILKYARVRCLSASALQRDRLRKPVLASFLMKDTNQFSAEIELS